MIYKFIDNNGSEITVNSISSLQALVDSETVKKDTKVKAGLRGKWTTAQNIPELDFEEKKEETIEEITEPEEDIKTFISKPKIKDEPKEEITTKNTEEPIIKELVEEETDVPAQDQSEEDNADTSDYYTDNLNNKDNIYRDENVIGLNLKSSIKICFGKMTDFSGRASRSEFWKFYLTFFISYLVLLFLVLFLIVLSNPYISDNTLDTLSTVLAIPGGLMTLSATVRRLHDTNKSGWWILISLIPFIGLIIIFILASKGTEGKNRFGDYPLKLKEI